MWLLEHDHSFDVWWDQKKVEFDQMSGMDVYNFLHMVSSIGRTNSNTACLGEEVDDLMEIDEEPILILLGKKQELIIWWKWIENQF